MTDWRIILHWTAGSNTPNASDKRHYHFIVDGDGAVVQGDHPPEANALITCPSDGSTYAAHTRGANTGAIGVALAGMRVAKERPFFPGPSPITKKQVDACTTLCARLVVQYGIPITRDRILTHAEVEPTLGIRQAGKWDIAWLPGMTGPGDPVEVGDQLRAMILAKMQPAPPQGIIARIIAAIAALFTKGN